MYIFGASIPPGTYGDMAPFWRRVYRGRAFEHRMQLGVAASITLLGVCLPMSIYRIKQVKNREAPRLPDTRGKLIADQVSETLRRRGRTGAVNAEVSD